MKKHLHIFLSFILLACTTGCEHLPDLIDLDKPHPNKPLVTPFASGLTAPIGIETDAQGRLWVTEAGTGLADDGQLSLVTPQGTVYPVVTGFPSGLSPEGAVYGLNHLILRGNTLWMLHGVEGKLYKFDVSSFQPGDAPLQASELEYEDLGTFVKAYEFEDDTNESDLFNLTTGPEGDLYIVDAGANAIIRRKNGTGELSIFAVVPPIPNPGGDPAQVESVPTGIVFDGQRFLVSTFTGFPFPQQQATIYEVDLQGNTSVYSTGLKNITDIELGMDKKPVVLEYGTWTGETFLENSGTIVRSTQEKNTRLVTGLNFPNSIERSGAKTYYVAQTFDGLIQKAIL
ncbi:ScyD/ScyE family protein [Pontibacter toksunensis]|uniref:ScyD/ScyE family protein n=1 Tax=Pontibacter toksunensis TaxID=1332631 RepID=A0ABW6BY38_9BACT